MLFKDSQILHIASSKGATLFSELLLLAEFTHFPGLHEGASRRDRHHLEIMAFQAWLCSVITLLPPIKLGLYMSCSRQKKCKLVSVDLLKEGVKMHT